MRGSRYSVSGYLNAILRRSSRTILVEGVGDQNLMKRLLADESIDAGMSPNVDTSDLIADPSTSGLGAKSKIVLVRSVALNFEAAEHRLGTLVDREWDGVLDDGQEPLDWAPPVQKKNDFVTTGHSIENYSFDVECVIGFLKYAFSPHFTHQLEVRVREKFPAVLAFAVAYSVEMGRRQAIGRSGSLLTPALIELSEGHFQLAPAACAALTQRKIDEPEQIIAAVSNRSREMVGKVGAHWIAHGHLGENAIWAVTGFLARLSGVGDDAVNGISSPKSPERDRFWHDWLSKRRSEQRVPLDDAIAWISASTS